MKLLRSFRQAAQNARDKLRNPIPPPQPGIYHYTRKQNGGKARIHLRVEADGHGTLLVNASRIYHFNPTATYMAYLFLESENENHALNSLSHYYDVPLAQSHQDYSDFSSQMKLLIDPGSACPVCDLELETTAPFSHMPSAPYRMDLALTYHCNNACSHCYNPATRNTPEMTTAQWENALDRLWELNIPHIIFTGGEPTLREDLVQLVSHAEKNGQITGLNTNGRKLSDPEFVQRLVDAGLDHVQITLESHLPDIHDRMVRRKGAWKETVEGIKNALASNLFVMTNTTLLRSNTPGLPDMLAFLAELGVPTTGLNTLIYAGQGLSIREPLKQEELHHLLQQAQNLTTSNQQRLVWYTPTQYCQFNPVDENLGVKGCTAALYNMCIEPDGNVLPCQSYYQPLGNFLTDPWQEIWNHPLAVGLRERKFAPASCQTCTMLQACGGGCPLARQAGAYAEPTPYLTLFEDLEKLS